MDESGVSSGSGKLLHPMRSQVYKLGEESAEVAFPEECIECYVCMRECPVECISMVDDEKSVHFYFMD